ncbi:MAG: SGNH/GDSL hydrolase family protein [Chloroflexota bacterium]
MDAPSPPTSVIRYVALGDSYTIGTSVAPADRWPDRLVATLGGHGMQLELVANLGVNGATSDDVVAGQIPLLDDLAPDFVTVLIGVNDVVRGVPEARYRANLEVILDHLLGRLQVDHVVTITTPDYTVTPAGADYGEPASQRAGIVRNNDLLSELSAARGIALVDIFDLSRRAATDRSLVASDGLHPSGTQYALWVARIAPVVGGLLDRR